MKRLILAAALAVTSLAFADPAPAAKPADPPAKAETAKPDAKQPAKAEAKPAVKKAQAHKQAPATKAQPRRGARTPRAKSS